MADENLNENEEPMVHDKRRIDPETGKVRQPSPGEEPAVDESAAGGQGESADASADAAQTSEETSLGDATETISEEELNALLKEAMDASAASEAPAEVDGEAGVSEASEASQSENEYLEDLRRVQAEYANYRRRTDREKAELGEVATADVVKQLLPVLDDLGRAQAAGDLPEGSALQVIVAKFLAVIEKLGVEPYGAQGDAFDPNIHEAVAQVPNPETTEAVVADVVQLGYRIGEREIRPAQVAVFVPAE